MTPIPEPGTMLAAVYRGVDDIRVEEVPIPQIGPGEVLVRICTCGVCGTDLKKIHLGLVQPPRIFGHEMAGEIVRVGDGIDGWNVGDRVAVMHHVPCMECHYCREKSFAQCPVYRRTGTTAGFEPAGGGFAHYIRVMEWIVRRGMVRIPTSVSYEEAAFIEPVNTCLKAMLRAGVHSGQSVLVIGQGPIGLIFTQIAHLQGATVYSTELLKFRRLMSQSLGAQKSWDAAQGKVKEAMRAETEGRGADVTILTVPDSAEISRALGCTRSGGSVILFAQTRRADIVSLDAGVICMDEKNLIGSYSSDITLQEAAAELIFCRRINVEALISHRFPLNRICDAIDVASHPNQSSLKVMIEP